MEVVTTSGPGPRPPPRLRLGFVAFCCMPQASWPGHFIKLGSYNMSPNQVGSPVLNKPINGVKLKVERGGGDIFGLVTLGRGAERSGKSHTFICRVVT